MVILNLFISFQVIFFCKAVPREITAVIKEHTKIWPGN